MMRVNDLVTFIRARHAVYVNRFTHRKSKPWTTDPILQQYRFCNVYRELDKVTLWITKNIRTPYRSERHLWFALVVARLMNWPATLEALNSVMALHSWDEKTFLAVLDARKVAGEQVFNSAYIVSTNGHAMDKNMYLAAHVLGPLWDAREVIANAIHSSGACLAGVHSLLTEYDGLGSFMAAQVIADLKYVAPLNKARDWYTWAASGPGSRRGLNRVLGRPVDAPWREQAWREQLVGLHLQVAKLIEGRYQMPKLHAQDLQNCLCEFDKYERTRLGEGKPRNNYPGR